MNGSITKYPQKNGRFSWGYYFRVPSTTGKRKWDQVTRQGFATKREAEDALREALVEREKVSRDRDPRTFSNFADTWLKEHCERNCEPTTVEGYEKKVNYAKRKFGDVPLTKLSTLRIERALNELRDAGGRITPEHPQGRPLSAKTIREVAAVVSMVFKAAIRWGTVDVNPMQRVILPRTTKQEPKVLEMPQFEWLLSGAGETAWLSLLLELAAATGCRRGELLALRWSDVDLTAGSVHVRYSLGQTKKKGLFLKVPKGRKDRRFMLPTSSLTALTQHRAEQEEMRLLFGPDYRTDLDLIFADVGGNYRKPGSVSAKVSLLARRLGFAKGISLHTLRHTHGSQLLSAGIPLPAVSQRLGHANTHVTATLYSHALQKDDSEAADAWDRVLKASRTKPELRQ